MTVLTCALGPDAAGTVLSRLLRGAQRRIDAAVYEVGPSYRWELVRAARRGVRVRLVLDAHMSDGNAATARAVNDAGGRCRVAGAGVHKAHGKLLIVDGAVAVGTGNLIWRDAPRDHRLRVPPESTPLAGTREWWVSASGAKRFRDDAGTVFDTHWHSAWPPPTRWSAAPQRDAPVVGTPMPRSRPDVQRIASRRLHLIAGGAAVESALSTMVAASRRRVLVTVPYAHPGASPVGSLLRLMADAHARGAVCGLLLGEAPERDDARRLRTLPFAIRRMDPVRSTCGHAKGMVADGAVVVSSANWSGAGLGGNWEVAAHIDDATAAGYFAAAWRRDWSTALPIDV